MGNGRFCAGGPPTRDEEQTEGRRRQRKCQHEPGVMDVQLLEEGHILHLEGLGNPGGLDRPKPDHQGQQEQIRQPEPTDQNPGRQPL